MQDSHALQHRRTGVIYLVMKAKWVVAHGGDVLSQQKINNPRQEDATARVIHSK